MNPYHSRDLIIQNLPILFLALGYPRPRVIQKNFTDQLHYVSLHSLFQEYSLIMTIAS